MEKSPSQTLATACGFVLELLWCTNPILNWLTQPVTMQCCTQWRKAPPATSNGLWLCLGGKFNEKTLFISTVNCQRQTWLNRACTSVWSGDSGTRVWWRWHQGVWSGEITLAVASQQFYPCCSAHQALMTPLCQFDNLTLQAGCFPTSQMLITAHLLFFFNFDKQHQLKHWNFYYFRFVVPKNKSLLEK